MLIFAVIAILEDLGSLLPARTVTVKVQVLNLKMCKYELVLNVENRKENWELDLRKQCNFGCGDFYHIQTELNE